MSGYFVAIEGPNGVGKSTVIAATATALQTSIGQPVHATKEPSASPLGQAIRELEPVFPREALALACAADRLDHVAREIGPQLAAGAVVITDRYVPSSLVLQRLDGLQTEFIWMLNKEARPPDLTVYLEDDPTRIDQRLAQRGETRRFESAGNATRELELYRQARDFLSRHDWQQETIACDGLTAADVADKVAALISSYISGRSAG